MSLMSRRHRLNIGSVALKAAGLPSVTCIRISALCIHHTMH